MGALLTLVVKEVAACKAIRKQNRQMPVERDVVEKIFLLILGIQGD